MAFRRPRTPIRGSVFTPDYTRPLPPLPTPEPVAVAPHARHYHAQVTEPPFSGTPTPGNPSGADVAFGILPSRYAATSIRAGPRAGLGLSTGVQLVDDREEVDDENHEHVVHTGHGVTPQPYEPSFTASFEDNTDALMYYFRSPPTSVEERSSTQAVMHSIERPTAPIPSAPFSQTHGLSLANDPYDYFASRGGMAPSPEHTYPVLGHQLGHMMDHTQTSSPSSGSFVPFRSLTPYRSNSSRPASPYGRNAFYPFQAMTAQTTPSVEELPIEGNAMPSWLFLPPSGGPHGQAQRTLSPASPSVNLSDKSTEPKETDSEGKENEDDVWLDVPSDDELAEEFHGDYITDRRMRRTRFESKIRALTKLFHEVDRSTDATMLLIASNPDQRHTRLVLSRSVRKDANYIASAQNARQTFAQVTDSRRLERASKARMIQNQQRPAAMKGKTTFIDRSVPVPPVTSGQSDSTNSDRPPRIGTSLGGGDSTVTLGMLDQLRMINTLDPNKMSNGLRKRVRHMLADMLTKLETGKGELKQPVLM